MDQLKQILKKGLEKKASHLRIRVGEEVQLMQGDKPIEAISDLGILEVTVIEALYKALFPRDGLAILSEQIVKSQFNIVNVGKITAIAEPKAPKSLHLLFPPDGETLGQELYLRLTKAPGEDSLEDFSDQATQISEVKAAPLADPSVVSKAVKAEATNTQSGVVEAAKTYQIVKIPEEVSENNETLALVVSSDTSMFSGLSNFIQKHQLHGFQVQAIDLFSSILNSVSPHVIFLDEKISNFKAYHRLVYDLAIETRSSITVILISETRTSGDSKAAFSMSVDGIIAPGSYEASESYLNRVHKERVDTFSLWKKLMSQISS